MRSSSCIWRSRPAASASRDMRIRSAVSSTTRSSSVSPINAGTISTPDVPESWSVSRMFSAPRSFAHTRPTRDPRSETRDLVGRASR
jgi:hypothetical protein